MAAEQEPGWYRSGKTPNIEQYWDGSRWAPGARGARPGTPIRADVPDVISVGYEPRAAVPVRGAWLNRAAVWLYLLAVISAVVGTVGGILLAIHPVYGLCFNADKCPTEHPFVGTGVGVIVGSLVNASLFVIVGKLCTEVYRLRTAVHT